jgi:hypothetical protein
MEELDWGKAKHKNFLLYLSVSGRQTPTRVRFQLSRVGIRTDPGSFSTFPGRHKNRPGFAILQAITRVELTERIQMIASPF